ncbi:MAG TPA: hypothetical protein VHX86_10135 [Tepidisphaeraceae bacterium]|jgi:hypothetical protein|nr:hypothetical protein [Tepidisphaeraceae bacterium]
MTAYGQARDSRLTRAAPALKVWTMPVAGVESNLADSDPLSIVFACILLLIVVLAGAYLVMWLRKRLWGLYDSDIPAMGFTLGDLRQLHRAGKISDAEFQHARDKVVAAAQRAAEKDAVKKPPSVGPKGSG